jgi:hypothetical protein
VGSFMIRIRSSSSRRSVCDHPFTDRVRLRRSGCTGQDLDAVRGEDRIERRGESGVSVSEQEHQGAGAVGEVQQQGAGGVGGPRTGRIGAHHGQRRPAGAMLDAISA